MPRHQNYVPHGVIPACLMPFHDNLTIDQRAYRRHLQDVAAPDLLDNHDERSAA